MSTENKKKYEKNMNFIRKFTDDLTDVNIYDTMCAL